MPVKNPLIFAKSEQIKNNIIEKQKEEIGLLYSKWAYDLDKKANYYKYKTTPSSWVMENQIKALQNQLKETSINVVDEAFGIIEGNMYLISKAVVKDAVDWAKQLGFDAGGIAFSNVPDYSVRNIITGNIYESGWSLSQRIWGIQEQTYKEAYSLVAQGIAQNASIYEICKTLEQYVRPEAAKQWNPLIKMKNTRTGEWEYKRIYKKKVDYNAQRLARTLAQHTYQQTFANVNKENPFVLKYLWQANGSRPCELCQDRDGQEFDKDSLPLDHPNGMCTMVPVTMSDSQIIDSLADWVSSEDGKYPEIDNFALNFGWKPEPITKENFDKFMTKMVDKYGTSSAVKPTAWKSKLSPEDMMKLKEYKTKLGVKWDELYKQYAFKPKVGIK